MRKLLSGYLFRLFKSIAQTGVVNAIRTLEATGEITITRASIEDELIE